MQNLEDKVKIKSEEASQILDDYKQRISQVIEEEREEGLIRRQPMY